MRDGVHQRRYVMTAHAKKEMNADGRTIYDVECCVVTGEIVERQKDRVTSEWKYRIRGEASDSSQMEVVAKFGPTGTMVIITAYPL